MTQCIVWNIRGNESITAVVINTPKNYNSYMSRQTKFLELTLQPRSFPQLLRRNVKNPLLATVLLPVFCRRRLV